MHPFLRARHLNRTALAETGHRLAAIDEHLAFLVGEPEGPSWVRLDRVVEDGLVDRYAEELVGSEGRRDVAGSYLGTRLAGPLALRSAAAISLDRRSPDPSLTGVRVRRNPGGWFDALAFTRPVMAVLPDDPAAGNRGVVVVGTVDELGDWWAKRFVAAVTPLVDYVGTRLPAGRRRLWGSLADRVAYAPLALARCNGRDGTCAWAEATGLIDALARHAPVPFARPHPFVVDWAGGEAWFAVKGTCCLRYRTCPCPDPCGEGYCVSCPVADDCHRAAVWRAVLEHGD